MGGSDDPSNLVELTVEQHAEAHRVLYEQHGKWQDKIAYDMLSGQITVADAIKETQRQYMKNRVVSDETRLKMAEATRTRIATRGHPLQGKKFSEESRKKMSDSHKEKGNQIGEKNHFFGKKHSDETKSKMSEAWKTKRKPIDGEWRQKLIDNHSKKAVINLTTGECFESIKAASEKHNIFATHISRVCKGKRKTAYKYIWRWK